MTNASTSPFTRVECSPDFLFKAGESAGDVFADRLDEGQSDLLLNAQVTRLRLERCEAFIEDLAELVSRFVVPASSDHDSSPSVGAQKCACSDTTKPTEGEPGGCAL